MNDSGRLQRRPYRPPEVAVASAARPGLPDSRTLIAICAALLLVAAALVLLRHGAGTGGTATADAVPRADSAQRPWQNLQQDAQRRSTQDLLASLRAVQGDLEARRVAIWGGGAYNSALQLAEEGDNLYSSGDWSGAERQYARALEALTRLQEDMAGHLAERLERGRSALDDLDARRAAQHFGEALAIEPGNADAAQGQALARALPQAMDAAHLGRQSEEHYESGRERSDLLAAQGHYQKALAIYELPEARAGLRRVQLGLQQLSCQELMSNALEALDSGRDKRAGEYFDKALAECPQEHRAAATDGIAEARSLGLRQELRRTLDAARAQRDAEDWGAALDNWRKLSGSEHSAEALAGAIEAAARLQLHQDLQAVIANPLQLGGRQDRQSARKLLQQGAAILSPGPQLVAQLDQVRELLRMAERRQAVAFISDSRTRVRIEWRADGRAQMLDLGQFDQRARHLHPGLYTAIGTRNGFQDVRLDFTVPLEDLRHALQVAVVNTVPLPR